MSKKKTNETPKNPEPKPVTSRLKPTPPAVRSIKNDGNDLLGKIGGKNTPKKPSK